MRYFVKLQGHTAEVWGKTGYVADDAETTALIDGLVKQLHPNDSEEIVYSLQKYYNAEVIPKND
jgi:hypothetical protein